MIKKSVLKIVLKYVDTTDPYFLKESMHYVGMRGRADALDAVSFMTVDHAKAHSQFTSEPTKVVVLHISVKEIEE